MKHEFQEIFVEADPLDPLYVKLIEALDALPVKELRVGMGCDPNKPGCALEALARPSGGWLALKYTLATRVANKNDSIRGTNAQRWAEMRAWCERGGRDG